MSRKPLRVPANTNDLYDYIVKPLLKRCNFNFFRIKSYYEKEAVSEVYFFTENFSGWLSLKAIDKNLYRTDKPIEPEWKKGEMSFLKSAGLCGINVIVVIELRNRVYYTRKIQKKYRMSDLSPFTIDEFFV